MKKALLILAAICVVGGVGYAAASKVWGFPVFGAYLPGAKEGKVAEKLTIMSLGRFMTNLTDPGRFIRVSVEVEMPSDKADLFTEKMSEFKTDIYALLRSKSFEEMLGENGLRILQSEVHERMEAKCPATIKNVFFSEFILQ